MKRFKLIALLVAAIMVCQSFAMTSVFAASANEDSAKTAEISAQAVDFLETVGAIVVDKEWNPVGLISSMTRSYAATVFANIIRGRQTTHYPVVTPVLEDVPAGKGNADNIFIAVAYDVIPEVDGKFNEKDLFTFKDMRYALTSLLGYNNYAKATGLGEAAVTRLVNDGKLFEGVNYKANMPMTKTDFAIVLKNALHAEMIYQENYSPDVVTFNKNSGIAMMQEYLGVIKYESTITATPYSSMTGSNGCQEDEVILGNMRCKINATNAADFIGCPVEAYVKVYDEVDKINEMLIIDYKSNIKKLEIDAEQLMPSANGFRVTNILYEDAKGKSKRAAVSGYADFFYNGVACDLTAADFKINAGKVTLISTTGSSTYNIVKIEAYENFVVDYINEDDVLFSKLGPNHKIDLNEDHVKFLDIRRANNRVVKLKQIKEGNVLSIYKSKDGSYVKAILSNTVIDGEIIGIDESGIRSVFTIDTGAEYTNITACYIGTDWTVWSIPNFTYPQLYQEGTFYLDANGYLTYAEISPTLTKYGYITGIKRQPGLDTTITVQLVDQDGNTHELLVPEKGVRTNDYIGRGTTKYSQTDVYDIIMNGAAVAGLSADAYRLIRFTAKNGMFRRIDFAKNMTNHDTNSKIEQYYDETVFTLNSYKASASYKNHTKMFSSTHLGDTYGLNNNTIMFIVDRSEGSVKPENVTIKPGSAFTSDSQYADIYLYDADEAFGVNAAVVSPPVDTSRVSALGSICVYDSMYAALDEEAEEAYTYVRFWYNGKLTESPLADGVTVSGITKGTAVFVYKDAKGKIIKVEDLKSQLWDKVGTKGINGDNSGSSGSEITNSYNYAVCGYTIGKTSTRLAVDFGADDKTHTVKSCLLNNPVVYVIDEVNGKTTVTVGSMSNINISLSKSTSNKAILGSNHGRIGTIVIYK